MRAASGERPGRWLRILAVAHGLLGVFVYRRELGAMAADGLVGSVPYRSERAGALWFIGSAFPGWLVGHFVDLAIESGDYRSAELAGALGTGAGVIGATLMPRSLSVLQIPICARIFVVARQGRRQGER